MTPTDATHKHQHTPHVQPHSPRPHPQQLPSIHQTNPWQPTTQTKMRPRHQPSLPHRSNSARIPLEENSRSSRTTGQGPSTQQSQRHRQQTKPQPSHRLQQPNTSRSPHNTTKSRPNPNPSQYNNNPNTNQKHIVSNSQHRTQNRSTNHPRTMQSKRHHIQQLPRNTNSPK